MLYLINNHKLSYSYQELKEEFLCWSNKSDEEFFSNIPELLHFVCIVSYIKELSNISLVSDLGIIHELVHMLNNIPTIQSKKEIRMLFDTLLILA